ncbi:hypothetical protein CBR_g40696 [Chara braunii]|uniref:Uncharacterized protein n=1 Tax=Chara braunii TaxID=69332 RepID=A0A388LU86_CHABU|nr:hypothetical protein CBR_g40696 [Chara braunii]|eukprot:GBG85884.1 hypothetical protein CBR_g40696 [Chara braunii]
MEESKQRGEGRKSGPVLGIDLGTSFCAVAVCTKNGVELVPSSQGQRTVPSYVAFTSTGVLVGVAARQHGFSKPEDCVYEIKRLMGRSFLDPRVQEKSQMWPFTLVSGPRSGVLIQLPIGRVVEPEEVSAILLEEMKRIAQDYVGGGVEIKDAVITVPAYFNDSQRQATRAAGHRAGLHVLRLVSEPTAAAMAYWHQRKLGSRCDGKKIMVFDLGGGTLDVSIMTMQRREDNWYDCQVNTVEGDQDLGGADFDERIIQHVAKAFKEKNQHDILQDKRALANLKSVAADRKHQLSAYEDTDICFWRSSGELSMRLERVTFEQLNEDLFAKCIDVVEKALDNANMRKTDIAEVVLAGGSTRIPKVRELLARFFGKAPVMTVHPDEVVAYGAAVYASILGQRIPQSKLELPEMPMHVIDVTPFGIGVELASDELGVLIPKNTPLPAKAEKMFLLSHDYQTSMRFTIYEGEHALCSHNRHVGELKLTGFTPSLADGTPVTRVIISVDRDGIVEVTAEATGNHSKPGKTAMASFVGTFDKENAHSMFRRPPPSADVDDAAIRAAFNARRRLQQAAWRMRGSTPPPRESAMNRINEVLESLRLESRVQTVNEYHKLFLDLKQLGL